MILSDKNNNKDNCLFKINGTIFSCVKYGMQKSTQFLFHILVKSNYRWNLIHIEIKK